MQQATLLGAADAALVRVPIESGDELLVDRVFHFAFDLRFSLPEIAQIFDLHAGKNCRTFDDVITKARKKLANDPLYRERLNHLLAIKAGLEKKYGHGNFEAYVIWTTLADSNAAYGIRTLLQGSIVDVQYVAELANQPK